VHVSYSLVALMVVPEKASS